MTQSSAFRLAFGGFLAMAAALGIGRFVYTPILPLMLDALQWSKLDGGLVASANFLGYLIGAVVSGQRIFATEPRRWLLVALLASTVTTAAMAMTDNLPLLMVLRFVGGVASAFVIVCASVLVLGRLSVAGRGNWAALHFAGVGAGIAISAAAVAALIAFGSDWRALWLASGLISAVASIATALLIVPAANGPPVATNSQASTARPGLASMIVGYGLFGFGYVITATFLVTIVRQNVAIRPLEPWIWMLVGGAAAPSVPLWQWLGNRMGLARAFAAASLLEAVGVAASVEWVSIAGICVAAVLLGGTFMGLTALGLMSGRALSGGEPQRALGFMSASFAAGQMIGPTVAGYLFEWTGEARAASLLAALALVIAACLAMYASARIAKP